MLLKKVQVNHKKVNVAVDSLVSVVRSKFPLSEEQEYRIRLVVKELMTNILSYSDAHDIRLSAGLENGLLNIKILDDGPGFFHEELMQRNVSEGDFLMQESGRGIFLVRMMAREVRYNEKGNSVEVVLDLNERND